MILVTGGSGFLGQRVCWELTQAGKKVLDFSLSTAPTNSYLSLAGDIADISSLKTVFDKYPIEVVVHLAALLHTASKLNPQRAFQVNVLGSVNLIQLCLQKGVRRFVFGSTIDMIGYYPPERGDVDETAEPLPNDLYGETKRFIEKFGVAIANLNAFQFISARIPLIIGPGQPTPTSPWRMEIFNLLKTGGSLEIPFAADEIMAVSHVQDSAEALARLTLAERPQHAIYNLPCESWRLFDLGKAIERAGSGIRVHFGHRRFDFCPALVNWERFKVEFGYAPVPLIHRLEAYARSASNVH